MNNPIVLLIVTQDTKEEEARFLRNILEELGCSVVHLDASVRRTLGGAEISPEQVAEAANTTIEDVRALRHEGKCLDAMMKGAVPLALEKHKQVGFGGVLGVGGSMGTTLATAIMRELPYGLPKLMVSTLASGFTAPFVGVKDIAMLNSVTDVSGLNSIAREVFRNAALAMAAMAKGYVSRSFSEDSNRPLVLMGALGTTETGIQAIRKSLEAEGCEVMVFHTSGTGGLTMDTIAAERDVALVLDISLSEILNRQNDCLGAGQENCSRAAIERGIPVIFAPGNAEFLWGPTYEEAARLFPTRKLHSHNPALTAVRATLEEVEMVLDYVLELARHATAPVSLMIPLKGLSHHDSPEGHLHDPEMPRLLASHVKERAPDNVEVITVDAHFNDREFADAVAAKAQELMLEGDRLVDLPLTPEDVADICAQLDGSGYDRLELKTARFVLRLARGGDGAGWTQNWDWDVGAAKPVAMPAAEMPVAIEAGADAIVAHMPGVFYRSPQPGADPFVEEGDVVSPETVVGLIETMKLMNPVYAGLSGRVSSILVANATLVGMGDALLRVDVAADD